MTYQVLTEQQAEQFLDRGHVVVRDCFPPELAAEWTEHAFTRLGYDRHDPSTWKEQRIHMPSARERVDVRELAPKAWAAVCDLLGGEERVQQPFAWGDSYILNLGIGADRPWNPPSAAVPGWHKDGDWFRHFLDSPEQGLLVIVVWSEIAHRGGGTFLACDSVGPVARLLADHPEGLTPDELGRHTDDLIARCRDFVELTGRPGDVVLHHPFMLHAASQNHLGVARLITNPAVSLREPMRFDRDDPREQSLVERAVLRGLGVQRYAFQPTAPRERIVPDRVARQQRMLEEERERQRSAG